MRLLFAFLIWIGMLPYTLGQEGQTANQPETNYKAQLNEAFKIPLQIRNTSDKPRFYIVRKVYDNLGSTQKGYFCLDDKCLEPGMDEFSKRIEPGETLNTLYFVLETGLVTGQNNLKFEVFVRERPLEATEHIVSVLVEDRKQKAHLFESKDIFIRNMYPNPVTDYAYIEYEMVNQDVAARMVIHNILGMPMGSYELPFYENKIKLTADDLAPGVYFYTLYLDNVGVLTRKLIVRK